MSQGLEFSGQPLLSVGAKTFLKGQGTIDVAVQGSGV